MGVLFDFLLHYDFLAKLIILTSVGKAASLVNKFGIKLHQQISTKGMPCTIQFMYPQNKFLHPFRKPVELCSL